MNLLHWQQEVLKLAQGHTIDESHVISKGNDLSARLQAYNHNYQGGLTSFLKITYPQVLAHLGTQYFDFICQKYIAKNPMIKSAIDNYGYTFPLYLAEQIRIKKEMEELAFLPDLAKVDWAVQVSYYASPRPTFNFDNFAQLTIEQQQSVRFIVAQDMCLVSSHWPLATLWQYHKGMEKLKTIEHKNEINWVMVERSELVVSVKSISSSCAKYLTGIKQGLTLAELVDINPDLLPEFISSGWIIGFSL